MKQQETTKSGNKQFAFGNAAEMIVDPNYDFYEIIEPTEEVQDIYKDAAQLMVLQLRTVLDYVYTRMDYEDPYKCTMLLASMAFALGCDDIFDKSQRQITKELGYNHGIISHHVKQIRKQLKENSDAH